MQVARYAIIHRKLIARGIFVDRGFLATNPVSRFMIVPVVVRPFEPQSKSPPWVKTAKEYL